jgi:hypothetical protein
MARDGETVIGETTLPGEKRIEFEAANLRQDRTGLHARLFVTTLGAPLASDVFNVEKARDRTYLANQAGDQMGDGKVLGKLIRPRLDEFCRRVWSVWIEGESPDSMGSVEPSGVDWLVEPFIAKGAGTIVYGPPKACKSWLGLLWAARMLGADLPWRCNPASVLFVNLERPAHTLRGRLWCIERIGGSFGRLNTWNRRGRSLSSLSEAIKRHLDGADLVIVDSLSRSGTGDLNANEPANEAMDLLNSFGVAWCILAHTPRSDSSHTFGSVMFDAAADFLVRVSSVLGENMLTRGVLLDRKEANDAPPCRPELWAFDFDERGLSGVRRPHDGEFPDLEPQAMTAAERIGGFLAQEGKSTVNDIAEGLELPAGTVRRVLNTDRRFTRLVFGGKGQGARSSWGLSVQEGTTE